MTRPTKLRGNPIIVLTVAGTLGIFFGANLHTVTLAGSFQQWCSEVGWPLVWGITIGRSHGGHWRSTTHIVSVPGMMIDIAIAILVTAATAYTVWTVMRCFKTRQFSLVQALAAMTALGLALALAFESQKFAFPMREVAWTVDDTGKVYVETHRGREVHSFRHALIGIRMSRFGDYDWMSPAVAIALFTVPFAGFLWIHSRLQTRQKVSSSISDHNPNSSGASS